MSETIVQETLDAKMRDGTVLKADVWRPATGGKQPVLLIRLPYDKSQGEALCYAHPSWYARQGYAVVVQDGRSCCLDFVAPMGPYDQRPVESWNGVLVYTSEPLPKERLVAGTIRAHIFAATNQPDTDWVVKVCHVDPAGRSINIQETIQRARFAGGTDRSRPIPAGQVTEFVLEVGTCAHVFKSGHRVRVQVASSHFPHWDRNLNTGNPVGVDKLSDRRVAIQTVLHDASHPSRVVLPVLGEPLT